MEGLVLLGWSGIGTRIEWIVNCCLLSLFSTGNVDTKLLLLVYDMLFIRSRSVTKRQHAHRLTKSFAIYRHYYYS